jgi:hypothetical protein
MGRHRCRRAAIVVIAVAVEQGPAPRSAAAIDRVRAQVARHGDRGTPNENCANVNSATPNWTFASSDGERQHYTEQWHHVQAGFVEDRLKRLTLRTPC